MNKIKVGYAICGSFCTISKSVKELEKISKEYEITPIFSEIVNSTDTRFGTSLELKNKIHELTGKEPIISIKEAEPIGPKNLFDVLIISPCTGNTLSKLANGTTDTTVSMAAKAHLRNNKPLILAIATNDGLGASLQNIAKLINNKNVFFVPFGQDDPKNKTKSLVCDFTKINETIIDAVNGNQIEPILI